MAEPFLGEIRIMSFNFPPKGWAFCSGQFLPINQNQALFALLGTTFGGNGQTTFALPNLQRRTPIHAGNGHGLGNVGGSSSVTLTASEMPQHFHVANATPNDGNTTNPNGSLLGTTTVATYTPAQSLVAMSPTTVTSVGGSQAHNNMQPYLVLNFCIALQGIFPSIN